MRSHIVEGAWPTKKKIIDPTACTEADVKTPYRESKELNSPSSSSNQSTGVFSTNASPLSRILEKLENLEVTSKMASKESIVYSADKTTEKDDELALKAQREEVFDAAERVAMERRRLEYEREAFLKEVESLEQRRLCEGSKQLSASVPTEEYDFDALKERVKKTIDCPSLNEKEQTIVNRTVSGVSDTSIAPRHFTGGVNDMDGESWIEQFERYCTHKHFGPGDQRTLFPLMMRDGAADWIATLPKETFATYDALRQAFVSNYFGLRELRWKETGNLWSQAQRSDERVEDFVTRIRKGARRLQLELPTIYDIVLHGLRPTIRMHVLQAGADTLDALVKAAKLAEAVLPQSSEASTAALLDVMRATVTANEKQAQKL